MQHDRPQREDAENFDGLGEDDDADETIQKGDLALVWRFLAPFSRRYRALGLLLLLVVVTEAVLGAFFPLAQRHIIDNGLIANDTDVIFFVLVFLAISAVVVSALGFVADFINARLTVDVIGDIREAMQAHILRLPVDYHQSTPRGATLSRFGGDLQVIEQGLVEVVPWLIHPMLQIIYSTALMFYFNVALGLLSALIFPIMLLLPRRIAERTFVLSYAKRQREAGLLANVQETLGAATIVKAYQLDRVRTRRFGQLNRLWRFTSFKAIFVGSMVEGTAFAALYMLHVVVFAVGVWAVHSGTMSLGTLVAFEALFLSMGEALAYVTQFVPRIAAAAGSIRHISELTETVPVIADRADAVAIDGCRKQIEFVNVSLANADARFALLEINLTITAGMRVAIVGASGAGKSTLLNLLMRFKDPSSGSIRIDGHDLRDITLASYNAMIGYVPQESTLFDGTIGANIALGARQPGRARIDAAASLAGIGSYIRTLPKGYHTQVGELGSALSVGQRQRLAIARALVRNPQILVLDEPTSALDPTAEAHVQETLWQLAEGRTLVCATHRLVGVANNADLIVMMQNGAIVETGSHAALLAAKKHYWHLWNSQAGQSSHHGLGVDIELWNANGNLLSDGE